MTAIILGVAYGTGVADASPDSSAHAVKYRVHIIRSPLSTVLKELATQTGIQIAGLSEATNGGHLAGPISGTLTLDSALNLALADTALTYHWVNDHTVAISLAKPIPSAAHRDPEPAEQEKNSQQPDSLRAVSEPPASRVLDSATPTVASPRPNWFARIFGTILTCGSIAHGGLACAQTAPGPDQSLTEIVVTGQRAALIHAQEIKREAIGVVDAISAEDVGKFPDENVADALQRVPGVSIDRTAGAYSSNTGESTNVTIRGFAGSFVNVLLNGRIAPSTSGGRNFSFDILPSEVISTTVVHKTLSADLTEGGIGGTVDIITSRPLNQKPGFSIAGTAAAVDARDPGSTSSPVTPKLSTQFGWTNDGGTFGWLLSGLYSKRDSKSQALDNEGWITNINLPNNPNVPANFAVPTSVDEIAFNTQSLRQSFGAAIDWIPIESVKVKFDSLLSNFQVQNHYNRFSLYNNTGDTQTATADSNGTALAYTRYPSGCGVVSCLANDQVVTSIPSNGYIVQNGLNVAWDINKSTRLDLDVAPSQAWDKVNAQSYFAVLGTRDTGLTPTWTNTTSGGNNVFASYNPATLVSPTNVNALYAHFSRLGGYGDPNLADQIFDSKLHLTEAFNDDARLDVGVQATNHHLTREYYATDNCYWYCGYSVPVPASAVGAYIFNAGSSVVNGNMPGAPTKFIGYNVPAYFAYLASPAGMSQLSAAQQANLKAYLAPTGGKFVPTAQQGSYSRVQENTKVAYAKGDFKGFLWNRAWALEAGVRYVYTDTKSDSYYAPLLSLTVNPLDATALQQTYGTYSVQTGHGNYGNVLPSANFKLSLRDDLVFRLGLSKTVTRPDLGSLSPATSYNALRPSNLSFGTGNPNLKPYTSKNVDMGLEWYINNSSYIAAEGFYKDVDNYITTITVPATLLGYTFQKTYPVNLNKATVKGAEFTVNYQFTQLPSPFDGLGSALNYTWVTSAASINPALLISGPKKFAIPSIGDGANAQGFYEKGPFALRLAYNWRAAYLGQVAGADGQPTTTKAYGQLDLSTTFKLNDHLEVFAFVNNLTDALQVQYQVYLNRLTYEEKDGRVFTVGVRGKY